MRAPERNKFQMCLRFELHSLRGGYVDGEEGGGEAEKEEKTEKKMRRRRGRDCCKQSCNKGGLQI